MKARLLEVWRRRRGSLGRLSIVFIGIVLSQTILYGPSLAGNKILLSLDLLAQPHVYLPTTPETEKIVPHDRILLDMIEDMEMARQFALPEFRAGRLPLWCPGKYAGAPCYRWCFSLPCLPQYFIASPVVLAYVNLLVALVAGLGAYLFFRRSLGVGFWPAAIAAWCFPLTGTFIIWVGYGPPPVVCWLPWILLSVDEIVRRPRGWGGPMLAAFTGVLLISGQTDVGGQVLLCSGIYLLGRCMERYGRAVISLRSMPTLSIATLAWVLGMLSATWLLLPMLEYTKTGARIIQRSRGSEERPPVGLSALAQFVLPEAYGLTMDGSLYLGSGNIPESAVGSYAGLLAALLVAPLAWCSRRHRTFNIVWMLLALLALSWQLDIPGIVALLRLPGLNIMSHNRFVFMAAFSVLAMAAVGLDVLWQGTVSRRWWFALPLALLVLLCLWCVYRAATLPHALDIAFQNNPGVARALHDIAGLQLVQDRFTRCYVIGILLSAVGIAGWFWLWFGKKRVAWLAPTLGAIMLAELIWFGYGMAPQCDPSLYYPRIPVLESVAKAEPGRIIGYQCLPPNLAQSHGLRDIRGYDGVDPTRLMRLMVIASDPRSILNPPALMKWLNGCGYGDADVSGIFDRSPDRLSELLANSNCLSKLMAIVDEPGSLQIQYAMTQWMIPRAQLTPSRGLKLSPLLDMMNVRYIVFRGTPPPSLLPEFQGNDYWVIKNPQAMPRVFVPEHVETVLDDNERLAKLASPQFDPRKIAYVESPVDLPATCRGSASITEEISTRVTVAVDMETPGLVELADLWDAGWNAYLDGKLAPILRTNHALRGVVVPAGKSTLVFRFEPARFRLGAGLFGFSVLAWFAWVGFVFVVPSPDRGPEPTSLQPSQQEPPARNPAAEPVSQKRVMRDSRRRRGRG